MSSGYMIITTLSLPFQCWDPFRPNTIDLKDFWKPSRPSHVGIHWIALAVYSQMSTHLTDCRYFSCLLHYFVLAKLATNSIGLKSGTIHLTLLWPTSRGIQVFKFWSTENRSWTKAIFGGCWATSGLKIVNRWHHHIILQSNNMDPYRQYQ